MDLSGLLSFWQGMNSCTSKGVHAAWQAVLLHPPCLVPCARCA